jgi:hypothetical protein
MFEELGQKKKSKGRGKEDDEMESRNKKEWIVGWQVRGWKKKEIEKKGEGKEDEELSTRKWWEEKREKEGN